MTDERKQSAFPITPDQEPKSRRRLPFSNWWPVLIGSLIGLVLRAIFSSDPGDPFATMTLTFIFFAPFLVGMVTIYFAERQKRRSWGYYIAASALANVLFILGSLVILFEGIICAILVVPLFIVIGILGGLLMGLICRSSDWPRRSTLSAFAVAPLVLGGIEPHIPLPNEIGTSERSILVNAEPVKVWSFIEDARDIQPEEVSEAWMYRIGVPLPLNGETKDSSDQPIRRVTMGKHVYFDQVAEEWEPNRRVHWRYHFYEDSFPAGALDDHVRIGGHYFDLLNTTYTLEPRGGMTELTIRMQYRVSTQFNWYAVPIAELLIGNFEQVILEFYQERSENKAGL